MDEELAGEPGGLSSGPEAIASIGDIIRALRSQLGWSQGRLAEELGRISGHPSLTREYVSRWEHGRKIPGPFWIGQLAAVFQVPQWVLEDTVRRRDMLRLTDAAAAGAVVGMSMTPPDSRELCASIAAGDQQPLAQLQTSHATDLALGRLVAADRPVLWRLARWADDGDSDVLRVNAAGVLAKTGDLEFAGFPAKVLGRDRDVRTRYLRAMVAWSDVIQVGSAQRCRIRRTPAPAGAPRGSSPATAAPPQCRALDARCEPSLSRRTSGPSASC